MSQLKPLRFPWYPGVIAKLTQYGAFRIVNLNQGVLEIGHGRRGPLGLGQTRTSDATCATV